MTALTPEIHNWPDTIKYIRRVLFLPAPASAQQGIFYYVISTKKFYTSNGVIWSPVGGGTTGGLTYKGLWDASGGTSPLLPANGDMWIISVAGTIGGHPVDCDDQIIYNSTSLSWDIIETTDTVVAWQAWVDVNGIDAEGIVGHPDSPFMTVNAAVAALVTAAHGVVGADAIVVHVGAGVFSGGFAFQPGVGDPAVLYVIGDTGAGVVDVSNRIDGDVTVGSTISSPLITFLGVNLGGKINKTGTLTITLTFSENSQFNVSAGFTASQTDLIFDDSVFYPDGFAVAVRSISVYGKCYIYLDNVTVSGSIPCVRGLPQISHNVNNIVITGPYHDDNNVIQNPLTQSVVERSAGLVATPRVITAGDSGKTITNQTIGAENYNVLGSVGTPLPVGFWDKFVVPNVLGMSISCPAGETINMGPISGTTLESFDACAVIVVEKINATQWVVIGQPIGIWSLS